MLYVGLMSGTSMDGIDTAIVDFSGVRAELVDFKTYRYPNPLLDKLNTLCHKSDDELMLLGQTDREVGQVFANAVTEILKYNNLGSEDICAIGSHGQTVRHYSDPKRGFTMQIGDPNTIAALTNIDVVADFRRKDIALGGQGAPLAPAFHNAWFYSPICNRVVLNIGGIANLTFLPKSSKDNVIGYDTGPGNTLLDAWCKKHIGRDFDEKGAWAAEGKADPFLLNCLLSHPYFAEPAPKSTGRETFHLDWLEQQLAVLPNRLDPQTVQATLVTLTCVTVVEQINKLPDVKEVYVCGGGSQNDFLMECLENELFDCDLYATDELGMPPDAVEAMAFAWFAYAYQQAIPGNIPSVTGASRYTVLGAQYSAR